MYVKNGPTDGFRSGAAQLCNNDNRGENSEGTKRVGGFKRLSAEPAAAVPVPFFLTSI